MYNFFTDIKSKNGDCYFITGTDFNHIKNVLRMKIGEQFLVSSDNKSDLCEIAEINVDTITAKIIEENYQNTSLPIKLYLFQGLPKSDKMELIIQKAVELGVDTIVPTELSRCVVKIEEKKKKSKRERWQAIAESAAKQSKRNSIPEVLDIKSLNSALEIAKDLDLLLIPYENKNGMSETLEALKQIKKGMKVGILIGSEGGFEEKEVEKAIQIGGKAISLGSRILRTETAAITALSMCMLYSEIALGE
ncbi:MAG: 16S rRNA (uracil(1498)-N(3))-methyltransferase [Clostridia bacterium]|nr:16S rRNA (uracil(1498)-N(3))-methyltransferase [Clostridia bacterium]